MNRETFFIDNSIKFTENYLSQEVLSYDTIIKDMYSSSIFAEIMPIRITKPDYTRATLVNTEVLSGRESLNYRLSYSYSTTTLFDYKASESGVDNSYYSNTILYGRDNPENILNYAYIRTDYIKERSHPEEILNYTYIRPDYLRIRENPENILNDGNIYSDTMYLRELDPIVLLNCYTSTNLFYHRETDTILPKDYLLDTLSANSVLYTRSEIVNIFDQAYYNNTILAHKANEDSNIVHGVYAQEAFSAKQTINQALTSNYYSQNIFTNRNTEDQGLYHSYLSQEIVYIFDNIRPLRTTQVVADIFRTYNDLDILKTQQIGQYVFHIPSGVSKRLVSSSMESQILVYLTPAGNLILAQSYDSLATENDQRLAQDNNY